MAERVVLARPRVVTAPVPPGVTPAEKVRAELKKAVQDVWSLPEAQQLRDALSVSAKEYGEALKTLYKERGIAQMIKDIAERLRLGEKYKLAWGKTV